MYPGPYTNGNMPEGLILGQNYFYASSDGQTLTDTPHPSGVYNFQYAEFLDLQPGTYTFGYASTSGLSVNWEPAGAAISQGSFIITADGEIVVPGTATDIAGEGTTYDASKLGDSVNPVFTGGTLVANENDKTYSNDFTLDSSATNTLDANGNNNTFTGEFSDANSAQAGKITFADSSSGGDGTVILTGKNTHTGGTTVTNGTLALSGNGTLGADSGTTTVNGGTLELGGTTQTQQALVQSSGTVQNGTVNVDDYTLSGGTVASTAVINASEAISVSAGQVDGVLNGAAELTKTGTGTVTLTNANGYTGGTTVNAGTLAVSGNGTLGAESGTTTINGGTLELGGTSQTQQALVQSSGTVQNGTVNVDDYTLSGGTLASTAVINATDAISVSAGQVDGVLNGAAELTKTGSGTVTLTNANGYTGGTTVNADTLAVSGNGTLGAESGTTTINGGTLELGGTSQTQQALVQSSGTVQNGTVNVDDYTLSGGTLASTAVINATDAISVSAGQVDGVLNGAAELTKTGSGTVTLTNANGYTGGTTVNAGTLAVSGNGTLGAESGTTTINGGTLELGGTSQTQQALVQSSGTVQNGTVNVDDYTLSGGTLASTAVINATDAISVSAGQVDGVLNGAAELTKTGSGTVTLTNANSYTGGTTVNAGTLAVSGNGTLGAESGTTTINGGTLELGGTSQTQQALVQSSGTVQNGTVNVDDYTLSGGTLANTAVINATDAISVSAGQVDGVLNGAAELTKTGSGTVTLTNANSYTGGTTIEGGALVVGNGAIGGSIIGDVANNGTLVLNRSDRVDFTGDISGTGSLVLTGGGVTQLGNNNQYEGSTNVASSVALGTASSFGKGKISNNGLVVFGQQQAGELSNVLAGAGSFVKAGAGALTLSGDGDFNGTFYVEEGAVIANSQLGQSNFEIGNGAILGGTGRVGNLTLENGSVLATGQSIGTLNVTGNIQQQSGSLWQVEVAQSGVNDSLIAGGSASVENGSVLNVENLTGERYALDASFQVLSAQNGVSGTYTLTGDTYISTFYGLTADYSNPNAVVLRVSQSRSFDQISGLNRNQNAVAGALQFLDINNPLYQAIGYLTDENEAKRAFTQLGGEIHSSGQAVAIEDSRFVREAAFGRLRSSLGGIGAGEAVKDDGVSWWSHGFGSGGRFENTTNNGASDLDRTIGGGFAGVDAALNNSWRIGALAGYSHSNFNTRWLDSSGEAAGYHVGVYGGGKAGMLDVKLGAAYSWQEIDTSRSISFTGYTDALSASYRNHVTQVYGEVSHQFDVMGVVAEPFANLAYVHLNSGSFTEDGGAAALRADSNNSSTVFSTLGLRASFAVSEDGATKFYGSAGWRHAYNDLNPAATTSFVAGGNAFSTGGVPIAQDAGVLEFGLDRKLNDGLSIGVSYSGQFSKGSQDNGAKARLQWKF
ncbi:autotransporter domain-containing protein [Brucella pseudogrignonensis]|uniref:autotransporter domain-containing protein n=1 Tax=Brucella pseudogrignonensis TaxID=419475 RepID=UPI0038B484F7